MSYYNRSGITHLIKNLLMTRSRTISGLISTLLFVSLIQAGETKPSQEGIEFFESKIRPVLVQHCYQCHAVDAKNIQGGLVLDSREGALKGGDSGPSVVPNNTEESLILSALKFESFEMPPKGKLSDEIIADFEKWIEMGAPDPRDGSTIVKSKIDFEEGRKHWAYQPVQMPERPKVNNKAWPQNNIDYFTLAKMEEHGLAPVSRASKQALIRRATYDLTGLPPTPADVQSFLEDNSDEAFARVIERLLNSPHYGERWGRYWLDVARYSEDQAHTFATRPNTEGFRYRDWVVSAYNRDMPFNQFVKLQIAGDLYGPTGDQPYEHLVALGYFGLGAQYYKNTDRERAMADELDDRIDTLTRGFLGLTVSCARCHDHKFDPIPTMDYYSIAGIFGSSRLHDAPLCTPEDIKAYNDGQKRLKDTDNAVKKYLADQKETAAQSKVGDIANYMNAVWIFQTAKANGQSLNTNELAKVSMVNEYLLKRWIGFLDPKNKGKVVELEAWFNLVPAKADSITVDTPIPDNVAMVTTGFQQAIENMLNVSPDGDAVVNLAQLKEGEQHKPGHPRFVTPVATKVRPKANIVVDIAGHKEIYLIVTDAGNGKSCDHADWIEARFESPEGKVISLSDLDPKQVDSFGGPNKNKNYQGQPIRVGGKEYKTGIGVHAPSKLVYDIPEGFTLFKGAGGLDNSGSDQGPCGEQATVQFAIYTEEPKVQPEAGSTDLLTKVLGKDGPLAVSDKDLEEFLEGDAREMLVRLKSEAEEAKKTAPPKFPVAHAYTEASPKDMRVFVRGNPANKREIAPRRFLQVLAGENPPAYEDGSGRKQLADDITSKENPLTPRVMANRIWQHHFGRGIVNTPSNFGILGDRPTHPLLLDYLARTFLDNNWSIKHLHREIMLSATYQLSTETNDDNAEVDADNLYVWRMKQRRLDIEAWRDGLLDVSGRLDKTLEGPSTNLADANNVRRTIYAKISRHELDSLLRLFDFPDANITSSKRTETTVPQQQLFVLNSPFMIQQAKSFSTRLHTEAPDSDSSRVKLAFQLAYGRFPSDAELNLGLAYLSAEDSEENQMSRWERYAQVILASNEFMYLD